MLSTRFKMEAQKDRMVVYTITRERFNDRNQDLGNIIIRYDALQSEVFFDSYGGRLGSDELLYINRQMTLIHQDWRIRNGRE